MPNEEAGLGRASASSSIKGTTLRAAIWLLATADGGRSGPILPGYRSLVRFHGLDMAFGVEFTTTSGAVAPGGSGECLLRIWASDWLPPIDMGRRFELLEGTRIVGGGTVLTS